MNVIKRGQLPQETTYNTTCGNCHSEIEFQESEGKVTYDQRDGNYVTVNCPVCQERIHCALKRPNTHSR